MEIFQVSQEKVRPEAKEDTKGNTYYMIFALFLKSMLLDQESLGTQAKNLNILAEAQEEIDNTIGNLKFETLPNIQNITQEEIAAIETYNEHISNQKQMEQTLLMNAKQASQTAYSTAQISVSATMQVGAANTAYLSTLNEVFKLINSIDVN